MKQKPAKITKQKPDKLKDIKARNKERTAAMERETKKRNQKSVAAHQLQLEQEAEEAA